MEMEYNKEFVVLLNATESEFKSGQLQDALDNFFKNPASLKYEIDLIISFNKKIDTTDLYVKCIKYKNVRNVEFYFIKCIPAKDNYIVNKIIYDKSKNGDLGFRSGANNLFYESMRKLFKSGYKYALRLECDCRFIQNTWIDTFISYSEENEFIIAGSLYKGNARLPKYDKWTGHINGVALYNLNKHCEYFVNESENLIKYEVTQKKNHTLAFDVALHYIRFTADGTEYIERNNLHRAFKIIESIVSLTEYDDINITDVEILNKYPVSVLIHQKINMRNYIKHSTKQNKLK